MLTPQSTRAQSGAPIDPETSCIQAGGIWNHSTDSMCAPCNQCVSGDGEIREDLILPACPLFSCDSWCECPVNTIFTGDTCVPPENYLPECQDEVPEATVCNDSGGAWLAGGGCNEQNCDFCLNEAGERSIGQCTEIACRPFGCQCPVGFFPTNEGCKPDAEVIPLCDDTMPEAGMSMPQAGQQDMDTQLIIEDNGCDQNQSTRSFIWLLIIGFAVMINRRKGLI